MYMGIASENDCLAERGDPNPRQDIILNTLTSRVIIAHRNPIEIGFAKLASMRISTNW